MIKEVLFSTLYNDINATSGYWRYTSTNNKTLLEKNIQLNPNFEVDVIEYTDPTEYFNIATNSKEISAGAISGINPRYWEAVTTIDGDITTDELLTFYNRLGLGDLFTNTYATSSSALTSTQYGALSAYSLSGFLGTLFNASAASATSATIHTTTLSSLGVSSAYTQMPLSGWNNVVYGTDNYGINKYIATNSISGLYTSSDAIRWSKINMPVDTGWTAVTYGAYRRIWIATNSQYGIYYSVDGVNWVKETSTGINTNWINITYGPTNSNNYYCAINNIYGIYYSADGITWTASTTYNNCGPVGWTDIVFNGGNNNYIATNNIYGIFYSTNCTTWTRCNTNPAGLYTGWIATASSNDGSDNFIAINSLSGIYYSTAGTPSFTRSNSPGAAQGFINCTAYSAGRYLASHDISGLFYSNATGTNWTLNSSENTMGWSTLNYNNNIYTGQSLALSGLSYSTTGSGDWFATSGAFETSGTYVIPGSAYSDPASAVFVKYSGNPTLGVIPYGNIKNTIHSSYQLHPFLLAFKQYSNAITGIKNLFNTAIPDRTVIYTNVQNRIDNLGNTVNYWLDDNNDFTGYTSKYEQSIKRGDKRLDLDTPFNFDALNLYYSTAPAFSGTDTPVSSAYYDFLGLTSSAKTIIGNQLNTFYYNIMELVNYSLYRYGQDTFGNVYMLYKKINSFDQRGQLWIRLKDHPIAFPAFIPDTTNPSQLSNLGQITSTTLNTLNGVLNSRYQVDNPAPISGTMQFSNVTITVSGTTGLVNNYTINALTAPVAIQYTFQDAVTLFSTLNITGNSDLSAYFTNDFTGYINGTTVSFPTGFTPTTSSPSVPTSPNYITFNSGTILLDNTYLNTTINVTDNNVFNTTGIISLFNPKLDAFYDFGFNYTKDMLYLDYSPEGVTDLSYDSSNTMFGFIDNSNIDANGNILLQFLKETTHNLETIPQNLINGYTHVDTIINEKDIFFIYANMNLTTVSTYIFKYNKIDGLSYKLYAVPVKYAVVPSSKWKATVSNSILSIAFMSQNPLVTDTIGNYVTGTVTSNDALSGGQTTFEAILPTSYLNGITVIQFDIAKTLPIVYDNVKYFYKQTDLGFYPQYYGLKGKNNFYANPVINSAPYYNLQLYINPANISAKDFIYEQTFNNSMAISSIYTDMLSIAVSAISGVNTTDFLYTTATYQLSSNPALSSEPMKWFRKFDLSGNYPLTSPTVSTGVDLSLETLAPSSYLYNNEESTFTQYNSAFFPTILQTNTSDNAYGLFELDKNYTIKVTYNASDSAVDSINTIYFLSLSGDIQNTVSLNTEGQTTNLIYTYQGIPKTYTLKLISATKKQFSITQA